MEKIIQTGVSIDPKRLVKVFNNSTGSAGIKTTNFQIQWEKPDTSKNVPFENLQEAMTYLGVMEMFTTGILLIKENDIREALYLDPISEYELDAAGTEELLLKKDYEEFEEVIEYCSNTVFEKILRRAVDLQINDMAKIAILNRYAGYDVYEEIKDAKENQAANGDKTKIPARKPKK